LVEDQPQSSATYDSMTTNPTSPEGSPPSAQGPTHASGSLEFSQAHLEKFRQLQIESEERFKGLLEALKKELGMGGATARDGEAPAGGTATEEQEVATMTPTATTTTEASATRAEATPAVPTPVEATPEEERPGRPGKLDENTMAMFWEFNDDLMCAEDWIAHAEKVGKKYNLDHEQLCVALHRRAVGAVKTTLEMTNIPAKYDWTHVCRVLIEIFGTEVRQPEFQDELAKMDKIAGLNLFAALDRVETLMVKTNHSPKNTAPLRKMLAAFPDGVGSTVTDLGSLSKTWPEAVADIRTYAKHRRADLLDPKKSAKPPLDAARAKSAGTVATVESAGNPSTAAAGARHKGKKKKLRCYRCGEYGHIQWQCPLNPNGSDAQSKN
jgi:Zinc knuckle